jgi:hypothetical protein
MDKPTYNIRASNGGYLYQFDSISDSKTIKKGVAFYPIQSQANEVELIFGDFDENGKLDVKRVSNNNDMILIFNTVILTVYQFFERNPEKTITFTGSSPSRNRLYRGIISKLIGEHSEFFEINGITFTEDVVPFEPNKDYFAFKIKLRQWTNQ